jgi:hypothetical protein
VQDEYKGKGYNRKTAAEDRQVACEMKSGDWDEDRRAEGRVIDRSRLSSSGRKLRVVESGR